MLQLPTFPKINDAFLFRVLWTRLLQGLAHVFWFLIVPSTCGALPIHDVLGFGDPFCSERGLLGTHEARRKATALAKLVSLKRYSKYTKSYKHEFYLKLTGNNNGPRTTPSGPPYHLHRVPRNSIHTVKE